MSTRKKPLSVEEKRDKLMLIFQTSKEPWLLKDLEKTASKEHGVVLQSVKDIVDSLVSDGLVNCEKIGTSNYFWSFPSTAAAARTAQLNTLEARIKDLQDKKEKLEEGIKQQLDEGRQESEMRTNGLLELETVRKRKTEFLAALQEYKDCDPVVLRAKEASIKRAKLHANRWTDNIFSLISYCKNTYNMDNSTIYSSFNIPEDFDSIE